MSLDHYEHAVERAVQTKVSSASAKAPAQHLTRTAFDLAPQHTFVKSSLALNAWRWRGGISESAELYIQGKTARLFVALNLDDAISLARGVSRTNSRNNNSSPGGMRRNPSLGAMGTISSTEKGV